MDGTAAQAGTLLNTAWTALGGSAEAPEQVELRGNPAGLLPSTLPALPAMLAAVSAATLAASLLDAARTERPPQRVIVDAEHVALAATSERYARRAGEPGGADLFAPLSRFWRTADGWLRLHANYPWHRERALALLGVEDRPQQVGAAIAGWRGAELEDALAAAGAVGAAVRTGAAWAAHPQGTAIAGLPLLHTEPHEGAGRRLAAGRAADGVRVLDLTRVIAGPVATRTLAAWGADVLRLDSPHLPELPASARDTLVGKRSASLDLREPRARARLEELLAAADVVVQGYRPGALAAFGLAPKRLAERHPHLVTITLSAWGATGPWSGRRGFDSLVQCATGIAVAEGDADAPGVLPAQVLDHASGYLAAAATLLALADVQRGGPPRSAGLSLAQTARWLTAAGRTEREPARTPDAAPHRVTLPGPSAAVQVIAPPGRTADLHPAWSATTDPGVDAAVFAGARGGARAN